MKKLCFFMIGIGIILTIFFSFNSKPFDIFCFAIPYIIAAVGLPVCEKKDYMFPITFLLVFVTVYNLGYFIVKPFDVDLMHTIWRMPCQYVLPLVVGNILQYRHDKKISEKLAEAMRKEGR